MAQQIRVDGALLDAQAETRGENIFKLHPEVFGVQFFGFHGRILEKRKQMRKAETKVTEASSTTAKKNATQRTRRSERRGHGEIKKRRLEAGATKKLQRRQRLQLRAGKRKTRVERP